MQILFPLHGLFIFQAQNALRKWTAAMENGGARKRKLCDIDPSFEANWAR